MLREFFLRQPVACEQLLIGEGNFDGVEVFALDVLDERHLHHGIVTDLANIGWDAEKSGALSCAITAFAGNDHIGAIFLLSKGDGLNDADASNGICQFFERLFVELATRL